MRHKNIIAGFFVIAALCGITTLVSHGQVGGNNNPYFNTVTVSGAITPTGGFNQSAIATPWTFFSSLPVPLVGMITSSADIGTSHVSETPIFVTTNATLTGACVLAGAGSMTDSFVMAIRSQAGAALANTVTTGTALATASAPNCVAFTATVAVTGPQTYWVEFQGSGTTAGQEYLYTTAPTGYFANQISGTYGTVAASVTLPTTFTTNKAPVVWVY